MKKQTLFLMAGGLLAFASCNTETGGYTEAYVDSVVNERVAQIQMELEEQNEARIHALALEKADSILAARAGKPGTTTKKTTTTKTTVKETPAEETKPTTPAPTGKKSDAQKSGQPTGKNSQSQQNAQPTGKK